MCQANRLYTIAAVQDARESGQRIGQPSGDRATRALSRALLRERARAVIRTAIASGELAPGEQIVEAAIAARIGVSRSPVREALRELEQHGLVVSVPNRGTFVVEITAEDAQEIVLLRAALEGLAARLATDAMGRRDRRVLEAIVERMERLARDAGSRPARGEGTADTGEAGSGGLAEPDFSEADAEFHTTVVQLSGHRRLQRLWSEQDPFIWLRTTGVARDRSAADYVALAQEHRELLDALATGDPVAAQEALWQHIVRRMPRLPDRSLRPAHWPGSRPPPTWGGRRRLGRA